MLVIVRGNDSEAAIAVGLALTVSFPLFYIAAARNWRNNRKRRLGDRYSMDTDELFHPQLVREVVATDEVPVFTVRPLLRLLMSLPVVAFLLLFGFLFIYESYLGYWVLPGYIFGSSAVGTGALVFVGMAFYGYKSLFYEHHFVRIYRGKIRRDVDYSEVSEIMFFPFTKTFRETTIILYVHQDGISLPILVKGNPKNRQLGIRLNEWLKTKVSNSTY